MVLVGSLTGVRATAHNTRDRMLQFGNTDRWMSGFGGWMDGWMD